MLAMAYCVPDSENPKIQIMNRVLWFWFTWYGRRVDGPHRGLELHTFKVFNNWEILLDFHHILFVKNFQLLISEFQNLALLRITLLEVSVLLLQDFIILTVAGLFLHCGLGFLNYLH